VVGVFALFHQEMATFLDDPRALRLDVDDHLLIPPCLPVPFSRVLSPVGEGTEASPTGVRRERRRRFWRHCNKRQDIVHDGNVADIQFSKNSPVLRQGKTGKSNTFVNFTNSVTL